MEIIVKKPVTLYTLADLNLDPKALQRATVGVVEAVKESFGESETVSKKEAERRVDMAVRFILRCVGDGGCTVIRALTYLKSALPVELAGLEFPIPTGDVYRVPERRSNS